MIISVFFAILLLLQIAGLFFCRRERMRGHYGLAKGTVWFMFALSMVYDLILVIAVNVYGRYLGWGIILYWLIGGIFAVLSIIVLVIGLLMFRKDKKGKYQGSRKKLYITATVLLSVAFVCTMLWEMKHYQLTRTEINEPTKEDEEKGQQIALWYLRMKYGDGDYQLKNQELGARRSNGMFGGSYRGFDLTYSTSFMASEFQITVDIFDEKVLDDTFLEAYYKETEGIDDLADYLVKYKISRLNEMIPADYKATISFANYGYEKSADVLYMKIPTLQDLCESVRLEDPRFTIEKDLKTEEEFLQYLKELLICFKINFSTAKITYLQESEYFRYKFDYSKIGMIDKQAAVDHYDGFGGYVLAGKFVTSEDGTHYENVDADKLVQICINTKVYEVTLEELGLK